jgi:hypothetical protein
MSALAGPGCGGWWMAAIKGQVCSADSARCWWFGITEDDLHICLEQRCFPSWGASGCEKGNSTSGCERVPAQAVAVVG